jgi:hypothetical protein
VCTHAHRPIAKLPLPPWTFQWGQPGEASRASGLPGSPYSWNSEVQLGKKCSWPREVGGIETGYHPGLPPPPHLVYVEPELDKNLMLSRWKSHPIFGCKTPGSGNCWGQVYDSQNLLETLAWFTDLLCLLPPPPPHPTCLC